MSAFICKFCGAPLELSNTTVCECGSCNRLQCVPLIDSVEKRNLLTRAEQLRSEQRYDKAIQLYEKMISLSPTDADLYWELALCRYGVLFYADGGLTLQRTQAHAFTSDSDYQQAVKFADDKQHILMQEIAELIDEKQRSIAGLAVGIGYDVLLCSGSDSEAVKRSTELYNTLSSEKTNVFFPAVTLDGKAESEWEPYIYAAVNSAKVLLVAATDADTFDDVLLMNICSRFLSGDMRGKAVIPILYGVLPGDLPPELSRFQAVNAANLGFEQDIIASIHALLSDRNYTRPAYSKPPLVRRAYIMLSDREFHDAAELCKRIEPQFPAEAALIRLLCEYRLTSEEELGTISADVTQSENYRLAMKYGVEALRLRLKKYALSAQENLHAKELAEKKSASMVAEPDGSSDVYSANVKPVKSHSRLALIAAGSVAVALITTAAIVFIPDAEETPNEVVTSAVSEEESLYENAKALYENAQFVDAESIFISLGTYNDSKDWAKKCRYMQADQFFENGDYEKAKSMYLRLSDYMKSDQKINQCSYAIAKELESRGKYQSAAEAFAALGSYSDSVNRKKECQYRLALELIDNGDLDSAEAILSKISSFSGTEEQLKRIKYTRAETLYKQADYQAAYNLFNELSEWSDSAARADDSLYLYAKELYEDKQYYSAVSQFSELGDYLDSRDMYKASWFAIALEKIDTNDKRSAYDILSVRLRGYEPAKSYEAMLRNEILNGAGWNRDLKLGKYYGASTDIKTSIDWVVLKRENGKALIITDIALEYMPFDTSGGSSWTNSSLRAWLNGEFYDSTFSEDEKALILSTDSSDKIFLLNYDEAVSLYPKTTELNRYFVTIYAQLKIPKNSDLYSWGRDGLLIQKPASINASTADPGVVFPAMWVKIG